MRLKYSEALPAGHCDCCRRYHRDSLAPLDGHWLCYPCYGFVRAIVDPYYADKHGQVSLDQ